MFSHIKVAKFYLPEEDVRQVEVGEFGKIVERGRENVEHIKEK